MRTASIAIPHPQFAGTELATTLPYRSHPPHNHDVHLLIKHRRGATDAVRASPHPTGYLDLKRFHVGCGELANRICRGDVTVNRPGKIQKSFFLIQPHRHPDVHRLGQSPQFAIDAVRTSPHPTGYLDLKLSHVGCGEPANRIGRGDVTVNRPGKIQKSFFLIQPHCRLDVHRLGHTPQIAIDAVRASPHPTGYLDFERSHVGCGEPANRIGRGGFTVNRPGKIQMSFLPYPTTPTPRCSSAWSYTQIAIDAVRASPHPTGLPCPDDTIIMSIYPVLMRFAGSSRSTCYS